MLSFVSKDLKNIFQLRLSIKGKRNICLHKRNLALNTEIQQNTEDTIRKIIQIWKSFNPAVRCKSILTKESDISSFFLIFDDDEILKNLKFFYSKCLGEKKSWLKKSGHTLKPILIKKQANSNASQIRSLCAPIKTNLRHFELNR
jgi:hypothetical protein